MVVPKWAHWIHLQNKMTRPVSQDADGIRLDEAIAWHIRLDAADIDEATWAAFTFWLEADPANRRAYDRMENLDAQLDGAHVREILTPEENAPNLIQFGRALAPRRRIPAWAWTAATALVAASFIIAVMLPTNMAGPVEFATRFGETKKIALADGTRIDLNTDTRVSVATDRTARRVVLEKGEALFHVTRDYARPFIVSVGDRDVRDVGTIFDIVHADGKTTIVVAEGRVAVLPRDTSAQFNEISLSAGDKFQHTDGTFTSAVERVDPLQAAAWQQGYLIYKNAPLSEIASDLNRYFSGRIELADKTVGSLRFSGILRIDKETAMLKRLSRLLPVTIQYQTGKIILRAPVRSP